MDITRADDERMSAEIAAHDEALKLWIEAGCCPKCRTHHRIELNPRNIKFICTAESCGWFALYPIARISGSVPINHYVLQSKVSSPGRFWNADTSLWVERERATVYREDERERSMLSGKWVKVVQP